MGIKQNDIVSFLEPESQGFMYDTARSFLKRHSNPESLLGQLKSLLAQGQIESCRDLIQLIIREGHVLADQAEIYLLRAQVAYISSAAWGEVLSWIQQAKLADANNEQIALWEQAIKGVQCLKEGDYKKGEKILFELSNETDVASLAKHQLAHHFFWKNINPKLALSFLEEVTTEDPYFLPAWSCLGFVYNRIGEKGKAQAAFGHCLNYETCPERIEFLKQQLAS